MPDGILVLRPGFASPVQCQCVLTYREIEIIGCDTRKFGSHRHAVLTNPEIYRNLLSGPVGYPSQALVHFVLHAPHFQEWVEPHAAEFRQQHAHPPSVRCQPKSGEAVPEHAPSEDADRSHGNGGWATNGRKMMGRSGVTSARSLAKLARCE